MKKNAFWILFFILASSSHCFSQAPPTGQIEKTQQDLEKERALREEIAKGQKLFIKKIIVRGVTQLSSEQLKEIILPFQKHWLAEADIQHLIDSLKDAYRQKSLKIPAISYKVEGNKLIIDIGGSHDGRE